ncbi:hypothetical protein HDU84_008152 [Entophlyctis sp. JEL0112]|nr:hypothetical protein HDU84_008152 [Entophlyctis sp. JEL0112]
MLASSARALPPNHTDAASVADRLATWARGMGFDGHILADAPLAAALDVEPLGPPQLQPSPHARKIQSLANLHRSRSESSAAAAAKRAKRDALRERVSALTSVVREKEEAIISLAHAVSTQEIQLNESRARLRETQRMADMIASFTEIEVGEFVSVLKEYAALIRGLLDVMTRRSNTNASTVTNVGDILNHNSNADIDIIRNVCSVIEVEYFRPENSTPDDDVSDKMNEESEGSTKVAYDELRESHSGKLAADIQESTIRHIQRYNETKRMKKETDTVLKLLEDRFHSIEDDLPDPDFAKTHISKLHAYTDAKAFRAVLLAVTAYKTDIETFLAQGAPEVVTLAQSAELISELHEQLIHKHTLIAAIMEANCISRKNVLNAIDRITSERIAGPQLAALKSEIENLVGFVAREMHALSAVRLNDEAVESLSHAITGASAPESARRACDENVLRQIMQALGMPAYLGTTELPEYIKKLKADLSVVQHISSKTQALNADVCGGKLKQLVMNVSPAQITGEMVGSSDIDHFTDAIKSNYNFPYTASALQITMDFQVVQENIIKEFWI